MSNKGISGNAFKDQTTLLSVDFGSQCGYVGESAFEGCTSLDTINDDNVITSIGSHAFEKTNLSSVIFNELTILGEYAFYNCPNLKYVDIHNCDDIPENAFGKCKLLSDILLPNVRNIGKEAFNQCANLKSIKFGDLNSTPNLYNIENESNETKFVIRSDAFASCTSLSDINLDKCVGIESNAFWGCKSLNEINLTQCENIGNVAFGKCTNIQKVTISGCSRIGEEAFWKCEKLSKVYINNSDKMCKLSNINAFPHTINEDDNSVNCNILFYFPPNLYNEYITDDVWKHYINYMIISPNDKQIIYTTGNGQAIEIKEGINCENMYYPESNYGVITFDKDVEILPAIFSGSQLTSVDLPNVCIQIDPNVFENCKELKNITLSNSLQQIREYTFKGCESLNTIALPNSLQQIREYAFKGCKSLNTITLPNSLNLIGEYAFENCEMLTSFTIPYNVSYLGEGIFAGCKNLEKFEHNNNSNIKVQYGGKALIYNETLICMAPKDNNALTEGRIYDISTMRLGINKLGKSCFHGCENLRRINIPSNITSIGDRAFKGCSNLCEVHFYGKVDTIGENIFDGVRKDFKIFVPESLLEYYTQLIRNYADNIYPKPSNTEVIYYTNDGKPINNYGTLYNYNANNGKYYKITSSGTIPQKYFRNQTTLTKIMIGDGFTTLSAGQFDNCENLEYIYLSDNITTIGNMCFNGCKKITRIHIPYNLNITSSNLNLFSGCSSLKEFGTYHKGRVSEDNRCYISNSKLIFFASGEITEYTIPNNINSIKESIFKESNISVINLNETITEISVSAFEDCKNLTKITNWDNVKTISEYAFKGCENLCEISLPSKLTTILEQAFENCKSMYITNDIPENVEYIGGSAFKGCSSFTIKDGTPLSLGSIKNIYSSTFYGCESLTKIDLNNIVNIESDAFYGCKISELNLPSSLKKIGNNCFNNEKLTIIIPNDLSTPPMFTMFNKATNKEGTNIASTPFGSGDNTSLIIKIPTKIIGNYKFSTSWRKYKDRFEEIPE